MNDNSHGQFGTADARRDGGICYDQPASDLVGSGTWVRLRTHGAFSHYDHFREPEPGGYYDSPQLRKSRVTSSEVDPPLLGLIHGQFQIRQPVLKKGKRTRLEAQVATGISVVIPVANIYETLMDEKLVKERNDLERRIKKQTQKASMPLPTSQP